MFEGYLLCAWKAFRKIIVSRYDNSLPSLVAKLIYQRKIVYFCVNIIEFSFYRNGKKIANYPNKKVNIYHKA